MLTSISKCPLSTASCWRPEGICLKSLWKPGRVPGGKTHKKCVGPLETYSPGVFTSETCPHWAPAVCQLQFRFSWPGSGSHRGFCSWSSAPVSCDSLYLPCVLSNLRGSGLSCDLSSPTHLRKFVNFQFFQLWLTVRKKFWLPSSFQARLETTKSFL